MGFHSWDVVDRFGSIRKRAGTNAVVRRSAGAAARNDGRCKQPPASERVNRETLPTLQGRGWKSF